MIDHQKDTKENTQILIIAALVFTILLGITPLQAQVAIRSKNTHNKLRLMKPMSYTKG